MELALGNLMGINLIKFILKVELFLPAKIDIIIAINPQKVPVATNAVSKSPSLKL